MHTLTTLILIAASMLAFAASPARAAVKTEIVTYKVGDIEYKATLAYDDTAKGKRAGIIVFPEWWGCNDYAITRAKMLAEAGYVALAADVYGNAKTTTDPKEAGQLAGTVYADGAKLRQIVAAAHKALTDRAECDASRVGAIGYCMGGTLALELARTGADLKAVVAFHASNITAKNPEDNKKIKAKVLICDGGADDFLKPDERSNFAKQMNDTSVDWQFISYGHAEHAFTNPKAGTFGLKGVKYDEKADKRSWAAMNALFAEALK